MRKSIGAYATPDFVILTPGLPKTRSGKIMRRILRKIIALEVGLALALCVCACVCLDKGYDCHVHTSLRETSLSRELTCAVLWESFRCAD